MRECCGNCKFWNWGDRGCHKKSPEKWGGHDGHGWPWVLPENWCGDWKANSNFKEVIWSRNANDDWKDVGYFDWR